MTNGPTHLFAINNILIKQEALQMQRNHATCHKYQKLHLKRLAIGDLPSRTLKLITIAALSSTVSEILSLFQCT